MIFVTGKEIKPNFVLVNDKYILKSYLFLTAFLLQIYVFWNLKTCFWIGVSRR